MIKLGFLSVILGELSFEEIIEFAAENGLACVEMPCWPAGKAERKYAGVSHIDVANLSENRAAEINRVLRKKSVTMCRNPTARYSENVFRTRSTSLMTVDITRPVG